MKKYQKIIKDNIDLISEIENSLIRVIDYPDDYDAVIFEGHLRSVFLASGQLELINSDYDYSNLTTRAASIFSNLLTVFASSPKELYISHELAMRSLKLSREINENLHYHAMRSPIFND